MVQFRTLRNDSGAFTVTIQEKGRQKQAGSQEELRGLFWSSVLEKSHGRPDSSRSGNTYDVLESRLRQQLPIALKESLLPGAEVYLSSNSISNKVIQNRETKKYTAIQFSVGRISYSSLEFEVMYTGAKSLFEIFDNNSEAFEIFLESYIPACFNNIYQSGNLSEGYDFEIKSDTPVITKTKKEGEADSKEKKREFYWKLANGTLILPVIVTLYMCHLMMDKYATLMENYNKMLVPAFDFQSKTFELSYKTIEKLLSSEFKSKEAKPIIGRDSTKNAQQESGKKP